MRLILIGIALFGLIRCGDDKVDEVVKPKWNQKKSTELHKELSFQDEIHIKSYIERKKDLNFKSTGSGLRYCIIDSTDENIPIEAGDLVCVDLEIRQMEDNEIAYKTDDNQCIQLKIDRSEAETGLQEGLKYLKLGDHAQLIIPYHLAHGLLGDRDKILPLATLIIDVKVVEIEK